MIIYEFDHEEGAYYGNIKALFSFKKSAEKKFGKWIGIREVENEELAEWVRNGWRIPYVYKPHAKRVIRFDKRKELKNRLKNRKYLYSWAQRHRFNDFIIKISVEEKAFLEHEFKSIRFFQRCCRNIDKYKKVQSLLEDDLTISRRL